MKSELKPCPFCGGEAAQRDFTEPFINGWIGCQRCHCFINWVKNGKQLAVEAWNRRPAPANNPLTLDELREMDGEPVWCLIPSDNPKWGLVDVHRGGVLLNPGFLPFRYYTGNPDDKKDWLAYRRKPEEEI